MGLLKLRSQKNIILVFNLFLYITIFNNKSMHTCRPHRFGSDSNSGLYTNFQPLKSQFQVHCGDELVLSTCRGSVWTNLSQFECLDRNVSARSLTIVLDTTTHMGTEISQVRGLFVSLSFSRDYQWRKC